jgi:signal recognition particle GTPase|tara:strand:+ start:11321 stop:11710 length:390 start_codon:yes stop_codon:yes gene_type:complete
MKLKKLLESTPGFENRKFGDKLPTLDSVQRAFEAKKDIKEEDVNTTGEFDYDYFIKQIEAVMETTEEMEYELLQTLDGLAENDDVYGLVSDKAEQAANQIRRYINGATKQLEGIQKLLDRSKRIKAFDQ